MPLSPDIQTIGAVAEDRVAVASNWTLVWWRFRRHHLALVSAGLRNKRIAAELGINEITVKVHRVHVMRKMRAGSLADLLRIANALGIQRGKPEPV